MFAKNYKSYLLMPSTIVQTIAKEENFEALKEFA